MTRVGKRTDVAYEAKHDSHVHSPLMRKAIDLRDISPETQAKLNAFLQNGRS